jgi:hypothetical protein
VVSATAVKQGTVPCSTQSDKHSNDTKLVSSNSFGYTESPTSLWYRLADAEKTKCRASNLGISYHALFQTGSITIDSS